MLRLRHQLRRRCLRFGSGFVPALGAFCTNCVFCLFSAFSLGGFHALHASSAVTALRAFTPTATSAPPAAASGFSADFRALFILWPGFCGRLCFALRLRPWRTWLAWLTWFARWAVTALGACFAFRARFLF